uniref:Uncharacterized protein n=1 Tax=Arundo donax TaxID=35708 RepID=A0A0A9G195_ARUDO
MTSFVPPCVTGVTRDQESIPPPLGKPELLGVRARG